MEPLERNEQTVSVGRGESSAVVVDTETTAARALHRLDPDAGFGAFGGELPGVFQDVREGDLAEHLVPIDYDSRMDFGPDDPIWMGLGEPAQDLRSEARYINGFDPDLRCTDPRQREQTLDEHSHVLSLVPDALKVPLAGGVQLGTAVFLEGEDPSGDPTERGPEVV